MADGDVLGEDRLEGWKSIAMLTAAIAVAITLGTYPAWSVDGWPTNHEGLAWKFRTEVQAGHFAQGDYLPIWSSEDFYGRGTPLPLYYHKAFYYVSGALLCGVGSVKTAVLLTIAFWSAVGCSGVFAASRAAGNAFFPSFAAAASYPLLNYALFDWLIRGAMAEYSAYAVVPWLLRWCLLTLRDGRWRISLGPLMALLYCCHSVLALYALLPVLLCAALSATRHGRRATRSALPRAVLSVILCGLLLLPFGTAMLVHAEIIDASRALAIPYQPWHQFESIGSYFSDSRLRPPLGERWWGTQLDQSLVALAATGFLMVVVSGGSRRFRAAEQNRRESDHSGVVPRASAALLTERGSQLAFLATGIVVLGGLQLRWATPFYQYVPGMVYLQFPWRLLTFLTPLLLLTALWPITYFARHHRPNVARALAIGFLVLAVWQSRAWERPQWPTFAAEQVEARGAPGREVGAWGVGEFLPIVAGEPVSKQIDEAQAMAADGVYPACELVPPAAGTVQMGRRDVWEQMTFTVTTTCPQAATVALPLTFSPLMRIYRKDSDRRSVVVSYRTPHDPRARFDVPPGRHEFEVRLPTMANLWR
jgi:hypothetical protein